MIDAKKSQRRQLVVDPKFQFGLIVKLIIMVTIVLSASMALMTFIYNKFIDVALPISADSGGVVTFGASQTISLSHLIWPVMLLSIIVSGTAIFIFGLYFSHKMAGPVNRLRSGITGMAEGDLDREISLREKDYFQLLATDINCLRKQWHDSLIVLNKINEEFNETATAEQKELAERFNAVLTDLLKKVS